MQKPALYNGNWYEQVQVWKYIPCFHPQVYESPGVAWVSKKEGLQSWLVPMQFKWTSKWQTLPLSGTSTVVVNAGAIVLGKSKLCMYEVVRRVQAPGSPDYVQIWWSLVIKIMHQADLGLNLFLTFSVCAWAVHLAKPQFTHLKNRNKNNTLVLLRVSSKTQKPLYIVQVERALIKRIRSCHSCQRAGKATVKKATWRTLAISL